MARGARLQLVAGMLSVWWVKWRKGLGAGVAALAFLALGHASAAQDQVTIAGSTTLSIGSTETGRAMRLFIWTPEGAPPQGGYPVLYAFDGETSFGMLTDLARDLNAAGQRAGFDPVMIVAMAYPESDRSVESRVYDMTPAADHYDMPTRPNGKPWPPLGGGDAFLAMIEKEIKPAIESRFPVDPARQTLFGHSLGGLMVLHRMVTKPEAFVCYYASSPSLWFNGRSMIRDVERFLAERPSEAKPLTLQLSVGTAEQTLTDWDRLATNDPSRRKAWLEGNAMLSNARDLAARIGNRTTGSMRFDYREWAGRDHLSARAAASAAAIRMAIECEAGPVKPPQPKEDAE
ncbi:alpha/beta hydrolase [Notoacmeibacter ruber]|uniref:Alpha/beta hydrolase n=1 Tax=Notoacmeibacter ruber TaxID=2670375 RepID=A0A3L7J8A3_9HYPH|nr:alpha/beta hydrolase-fold protein [Notoacmeibacter ruber]RLQ86846.1 alpha/beta hydrolase [Notoacmeibacter ruber]